MIRKFNVKENVVDYVVLKDNGKPFGQIVYTYTAPTHWGSDGICKVVEDYRFDTVPTTKLHWSAGGVNKDVTDIEIAYTMSKAFELAQQRLIAIAEDFGQSMEYRISNNEVPKETT
jgi:hypothetical protein